MAIVRNREVLHHNIAVLTVNILGVKCTRQEDEESCSSNPYVGSCMCTKCFSGPGGHDVQRCNVTLWMQR